MFPVPLVLALLVTLPDCSDGSRGQAHKLTAADGAADDRFGNSVAVSSDGARVAVGAYGDDGWGPDSGSVYVFDGSTGAQLRKLMAADEAADDHFGISVALSSNGALVAVGAYADDDQFSDSGSVYIFDGSTGAQLHKLTAADGSASDLFGMSVALSSDGSRVAVGAPYDDDRGSGSGSVYVFDGSTGAQLGKLTAADGAFLDVFGYSVALSSDGARVAVGAYKDEDRGSDSGSAYVFDGSTGAQLSKLTAADGKASDYFGCSVAMSADGARVAVGAWYDDSGSGSVYVFDGSTGAQIKLRAADRAAYDYFGYSVALSSDGARVAVGSYYDDDKGSASGSVYVFDGFTGAQLHKLTAADGAASDNFGYSVALSSDGAWVAVGAYAPYADDRRGSAYVFAESADSAPTPAPCTDDDDHMIALASGAGYTISGCADAESFCENAAYGSIVQATCPVTCGLCTLCADDDDHMIALASGAGYTISGCADAESCCENAAYGSTVQATCPLTCGSCASLVRRLADGKDHNVDELGWIEEMTVPQADRLDQID